MTNTQSGDQSSRHERHDHLVSCHEKYVRRNRDPGVGVEVGGGGGGGGWKLSSLHEPTVFETLLLTCEKRDIGYNLQHSETTVVQFILQSAGGFLLACDDFGRMFDNFFPACGVVLFCFL